MSKKKKKDESMDEPVGKSTAGMGVDPSMKNKDGGPDDYEAESAMNDLMRAEEHKSNKDLMKRVSKKIGRKHRSIQSLKDTYNEKYGRDAMESKSDSDGE
jgi:hypothetical protein